MNNNLYIRILICAVLGYLVGSINLSFILGKFKGFDIREHGSGNAGASNLMITMGKRIGAVVALLDVFKAFLIVRLILLWYAGDILAGFICATFVVLGNIFPFYIPSNRSLIVIFKPIRYAKVRNN